VSTTTPPSYVVAQHPQPACDCGATRRSSTFFGVGDIGMKRCLKWADYNGRACVSGAAREQRHSSTHTRAIMSGGCSYVSGAGGARRTGDGEGKGESMGWSFAALWTAVGLVLGSNIGVLLRRGHARVIRGPAQGGTTSTAVRTRCGERT
jgi:hypothetical protein